MNLLLDRLDHDVLETLGDPRAVEISGVAHDSRRVEPGDLFVCLTGLVSDGHGHAAEAVARGAAGLVCERFVAAPVVQARVPVGSARSAMARVSAAFYGYPSRELSVVGVTGTNGKTTVSHLLAAILQHVGRPVTLIGTLSGERTTPESTDLQRLLAGVRDDQRADGVARAVVMEVSSHSLVQSRVDCVDFDLAVFTNLSHDHLDFHRTMESYWQAKASLFSPARARRGVVNGGDPWGRRLLESGAIPLKAVTGSEASNIVLEPGRTTFRWRSVSVVLPLTGLFNVENAVLAAEAAVELGIDPLGVAEGLGSAHVIPGRIEPVEVRGGRGDGPTVLVDYAHTPAALRAVLAEASRLVTGRGRVVLVFGCGGDRDRSKRPIMGSVAVELSAVTVLTSDNPRHEEPSQIIEEVRAGIPVGAEHDGRLTVEPDRRRAIERAVAMAGAGDVVVIAGKGHETYQQFGDDRVPFDDRTVAAEALASANEA
jgi:UDP-N-acetylmuramoyl-L-alanyl-D-glutamate--2,6-diaminopimelate ligase